MILPVWARLDWSWLTSFTCLGPCLGNESDSALVHVVFYLPSGCSGLFPRHLAVLQEKEGKHTRSPEARVLAQTQLFYCLPSAKESHRPSPDSRFGEMDLLLERRNLLLQKERSGVMTMFAASPRNQ